MTTSSPTEPSGMRFDFALATASRRADESEDRAAIHELPRALAIVLADGAGGIPGGALAADIVLRVVATTLDTTAGVTQLDLIELLRRVDRTVEASPLAGETTAIVAIVTEDGIAGASCGDSGAWIVKADGYRDLTVDQKRKLRVGSGRATPVAFAYRPFDGALVLGSDGLFNYVQSDHLCRVARDLSPTAAVQELVNAARNSSGDLRDDVAVAIVRPRT